MKHQLKQHLLCRTTKLRLVRVARLRLNRKRLLNQN